MKSIQMILFLSVFGATTVAPTNALARTLYFGSETETVTLVAGNATLFRFTGEVRTISQASRFEITPANADQPNYSLLSIRPRFSFPAARMLPLSWLMERRLRPDWSWCLVRSQRNGLHL